MHRAYLVKITDGDHSKYTISSSQILAIERQSTCPPPQIEIICSADGDSFQIAQDKLNFAYFLLLTNNYRGYEVKPIMTMGQCRDVTPLNYQIIHNLAIITEKHLVKNPRIYLMVYDPRDSLILQKSAMGETSVLIQNIDDPTLLDYCSLHRFELSILPVDTHLKVNLNFYPQSKKTDNELAKMNSHILEYVRAYGKQFITK